MDNNTYKVLKFYNVHPNEKYSIATLSRLFPNISINDLREITTFLYKDGYLRALGDCSFQSTNKGKTYTRVVFNNWISENIVALIALSVSIIALIFSILAFFMK